MISSMFILAHQRTNLCLLKEIVRQAENYSAKISLRLQRV